MADPFGAPSTAGSGKSLSLSTDSSGKGPQQATVGMMCPAVSNSTGRSVGQGGSPSRISTGPLGPRAEQRTSELSPTAQPTISAVVQVPAALARPPLPLPTAQWRIASAPASPASSVRSGRTDHTSAQRARSSSVAVQPYRAVPFDEALRRAGIDSGPGAKRKSEAIMDEVRVDAGTPVRALARPSTNSKASSPSPGTPKRLALPSVPVGTSDPAPPVGAHDEVKDIVMAGTGNVVDPPGAVAPEDRACDPSGALAFQGSSMSSSAAAARAEVKVRVQSSPTLERHVERLEAHIVVLERRATELKTALDLKTQENVQNFQAALAFKDRFG